MFFVAMKLDFSDMENCCNYKMLRLVNIKNSEWKTFNCYLSYIFVNLLVITLCLSKIIYNYSIFNICYIAAFRFKNIIVVLN